MYSRALRSTGVKPSRSVGSTASVCQRLTIRIAVPLAVPEGAASS